MIERKKNVKTNNMRFHMRNSFLKRKECRSINLDGTARVLTNGCTTNDYIREVCL